MTRGLGTVTPRSPEKGSRGITANSESHRRVNKGGAESSCFLSTERLAFAFSLFSPRFHSEIRGTDQTHGTPRLRKDIAGDGQAVGRREIAAERPEEGVGPSETEGDTPEPDSDFGWVSGFEDAAVARGEVSQPRTPSEIKGHCARVAATARPCSARRSFWPHLDTESHFWKHYYRLMQGKQTIHNSVVCAVLYLGFSLGSHSTP